MDADGIEGTQQEVECTLVDPDGRRLAIYGSGGWAFESPRARHVWVVDLDYGVSEAEQRRSVLLLSAMFDGVRGPPEPTAEPWDAAQDLGET